MNSGHTITKEPGKPPVAAVFYHALAASEWFRRYQMLFLKSHGLSLRMLPVEGGGSVHEQIPNPFCRLAAQNPDLSAHCKASRCVVQQKIRASTRARKFRCHAGLTEIGVPVIVTGTHVATVLAGRVADHAPSEADFSRVEILLGGRTPKPHLEKLRQAYLRTRFVEQRELRYLTQLLDVIARHMVEQAGTIHPRSGEGAPRQVQKKAGTRGTPPRRTAKRSRHCGKSA